MTKLSPNIVVGLVDDLQAARAIRRALVDQGIKARLVDFVAIGVNAREKRARWVAGLALSRGLGRFARDVKHVVQVADPFDRCELAIANGESKVALGLWIDSAVGVDARAFVRRG